MGLIDSTNRVERALVSAKTERQAERERERLERRYKAELKAELEGAKSQALEELRSIITSIYDLLGYEQAHFYFKSLNARENVISKITQKEVIKRVAFENYNKILNQIDKEQKQNFEYEQEKNEGQSGKSKVEANAAIAIAKLFLAILRTIAGAVFLLLLVLLGVVDLANTASKPKRRRYRR